MGPYKIHFRLPRLKIIDEQKKYQLDHNPIYWKVYHGRKLRKCRYTSLSIESSGFKPVRYIPFNKFNKKRKKKLPIK